MQCLNPSKLYKFWQLKKKKGRKTSGIYRIGDFEELHQQILIVTGDGSAGQLRGRQDRRVALGWEEQEMPVCRGD